MDVSLTGFASLLQDEGRSIKRGENHNKSGHVESGSYAEGENSRWSERQHDGKALLGPGKCF